MIQFWAFLTGFLASILGTWLILAIAQRQYWRSVILDFAVGTCGVIAFQLWASTANDWRVLAAELVGSVCGTAIALTNDRNRQ